MDENTKKIIKERFDALPESIQEIILSSHYEETLLEIGKQYELKVEQMGTLERETTMVMMGLTPTKDFQTELTRELAVETEKGSQIVKDINEKIFLKIRELLKLMNTPKGEEPSLEEEAAEKENKNTDQAIMKSAGIEIITSKEEIHPILAQKLSEPVQVPSTKTEHNLENITKPARPPLSGAGGTNTPTTSDTKIKIPNTDPYREKPE